jgi:hypothetical protein
MLEIIKAIFIAGLPVGLVGFGLVLWSIKNKYIGIDDDLNTLKQRKIDSDDKESEFKLNPIHQKWLFFGGGYYGTLAFITYVHLEALEVIEFFDQYTSFSNLVEQITFGALIRLLVESFLNLIPAFVWFTYWPDVFTINNGWYWLIASYIGFEAGRYLAKKYAKRLLDLEQQ